MPSHAAPAAPSASPAPSSAPARPWLVALRVAALVAAVLLLGWLALTVRLPDLDTLRARLESFGFWSGAAFIALYAVVALTPIPVTIMAVAAGLLFGVVEGSVLSVIGAMLGSMGAYGIARLLGQDTVLRLLGRRGATVQERLEEAGFLAILTLRAAPGLPYWPVNYGAGALGVPFATFTSAAALGSMPGQVSLVAIGAFIARPGVFTGIVVGVSWAVVLATTAWAWRRWRAQRSG